MREVISLTRVLVSKYFHLVHKMFQIQQNSSASERAEIVLVSTDKGCKTLAMAVIQLFLTDICQLITRRKHECGVLCLVKDSGRHSYFFQVHCIFRRKMVWEHEVCHSLEYSSPTPFLLTFQENDIIVTFKFSNEDEARHLRNVLLEMLKKIYKRRPERLNHQSGLIINQHSHTQVSSQVSTVDSPLSDDIVLKQKPLTAVFGGKRREKEPKPKLTKADIGLPQNFRHVSHVGWDPNTEFSVDNVEDPQLKQFYYKAGVSDSQLQDRETREFIYDFIKRHGGIDAVKNELVLPPTLQAQPTAPPAPERTGTTSTKNTTRNLGVGLKQTSNTDDSEGRKEHSNEPHCEPLINLSPTHSPRFSSQMTNPHTDHIPSPAPRKFPIDKTSVSDNQLQDREFVLRRTHSPSTSISPHPSRTAQETDCYLHSNEKAGVSGSQIENCETRELVYDFVNRHGGIDVKNEQSLPSTSQAHHTAHTPPVPTDRNSIESTTNSVGAVLKQTSFTDNSGWRKKDTNESLCEPRINLSPSHSLHFSRQTSNLLTNHDHNSIPVPAARTFSIDKTEVSDC